MLNSQGQPIEDLKTVGIVKEAIKTYEKWTKL